MREELLLVDDVLREALAPQRHGFLVHLGEAETTLPPPVLATILVGDKPRGRCQLPRRHLREVHVPTGPSEAPRRRVREGGLVGGVEGAEAEAHVAGPNLGGEGAGGARADAAVARNSLAARRHGGAVVVRRRRGEKAVEGAGRERQRARSEVESDGRARGERCIL